MHMAQMTKRERCMAAVNCQPVDRVPVGFWYHFRLDFPSAAPLAEAELAFAKKYDPDLLKVMHDLVLDLPDGMTEIKNPDDWWKIKPLNPREGNFAEQLKALKLIKQGLHKDMPVIDTVFNPYASANKLCGKKLLEHLHANPDAVKHALQAISVSLSDYANAWVEEGGDGVYYALDGCQTTTMSEDEYREVFMPFDRMVLNAAMEQGTFNMLHLHGENIMFDMLHDLPNSVLVWSDRLTPPSLSEGRGIHQGCIAGGINEMTFHEMTLSEVTDQARSAIAEAGSIGFILTPGCAISTDSPEDNIFALRQSVGT
jgi:uroporphyrinogen decarboxylase